MADTEIAPFINRLGYTLLAEVDSFHEVEDQLYSLLCLLMRLSSVLIEVERKQSEDLEKFMMKVVTLVYEAKKSLVMDEADQFRSKIRGFKSQIKRMMESNAWFHRFTESSTCNTSSLSKRPLPPPIEDGDAVVVLEDEVKKMINLLKDEDQDGQHDIIPVVGPEAIGKTTFHFPCRSWINKSEKIKPTTTPTVAAADNTKEGDQRKKMKNLKDLAIETYKHLKNSARYLVVFYDKRGSKIILITRHDEVPSHARSSRTPFYSRWLSKDEGQTLFSKIVTRLVDSHSHTQLDTNHYHTYHELVDACGGLPLAIIESESDKRLPLEICECIYNGQPCHLRMCLPYYHVLKESLVNLPPPRVKIQSRDQASSSIAATTEVVEMEDIAEEYLNELINMNLIKVQRSFDDRIKEITILRQYYSLLDLFRSEATSNKMKKLEASSLFINYLSGNVLPHRVLDLMHVDLYNNPRIINLIQLRYLQLEIDSYPSDFIVICLSNLWNLQFVKMKLPYTSCRFQVEFWETQQLRHFLSRGLPLYPLVFDGDIFINPSLIIEKEVNSSHRCKISLKNHLTLEGLDPQYCREDVLSMMPNLVRLRLDGGICEFDDQLAHVFPLLEPLQKLHVEGRWKINSLSKLEIFPPNITHLTLVMTHFKTEYLVWALRKLQNLRTLKFGARSIFGIMPSLQKLTIISCEYLMGLPSVALETIPTLQELELQGVLEDQVLRDAPTPFVRLG
ncbi:hypothetical protein NE237_017899 [Protea cynaroides]|uniref:Uncharacterized protein n=1 Tax=Protea cynaroides TaxID=273540 RepID=A0A9Q0K8Y5_9MAGN|nr:hypothetical protein NE237_017899 [Protea cynaroides]